jgi:hypothetical protein
MITAREQQLSFMSIDREIGLYRMALGTRSISVGFRMGPLTQQAKLDLICKLPGMLDGMDLSHWGKPTKLVFGRPPWTGGALAVGGPHTDGFGTVYLDPHESPAQWEALLSTQVDWAAKQRSQELQGLRSDMENTVASALGVRTVCGQHERLTLTAEYINWLNTLYAVCKDPQHAQALSALQQADMGNLVLMGHPTDEGPSSSFDPDQEHHQQQAPLYERLSRHLHVIPGSGIVFVPFQFNPSQLLAELLMVRRERPLMDAFSLPFKPGGKEDAFHPPSLPSFVS